MARKRTSLSAVLGAEPAAARREPAPSTAPRVPAPAPERPYKQLTVYLPIPVYEQLRRLAFDERSKMHRLLLEGLDRVFRDRGLASLGDLDQPED